MKPWDIIFIAIGNLKRNKLRTLLTVSGVVVGIGAIVFLVSLGFGLQNLATEKIVKLDALKVITVTPGSQNDIGIDQKIIEKLQKVENVEAVSPIVRGLASFNYKTDTSKDIIQIEQIIYGLDPKYFSLENIKITVGKNFSNDEAKEVLVSKEVLASNSLKPNDLLNKEFDFLLRTASDEKTIKMKIIGLIDEKGIYAPIKVMEGDNVDQFASAKVKVNEKTNVPLTKKVIESFGFNTQVMPDQSKAVSQIFYIINIILAGFGMIALFVAAIGIFNTMTISLLERTHEIGVMKAIGGNDGDIAMIFICESALIGFLGGVFGLLGGVGIGWLINQMINFLATESGGESNILFVTPSVFSIITVVFSFIVSTIAGIWPARRASKLNPLEALRYE
ncbi:ABC transporter permease [Patescibacteria group bacterium]|nr:ABC transporter permease [Patescibacteria group bacterium]